MRGKSHTGKIYRLCVKVDSRMVEMFPQSLYTQACNCCIKKKKKRVQCLYTRAGFWANLIETRYPANPNMQLALQSLPKSQLIIGVVAYIMKITITRYAGRCNGRRRALFLAKEGTTTTEMTARMTYNRAEEDGWMLARSPWQTHQLRRWRWCQCSRIKKSKEDIFLFLI